MKLIGPDFKFTPFDAGLSHLPCWADTLVDMVFSPQGERCVVPCKLPEYKNWQPLIGQKLQCIIFAEGFDQILCSYTDQVDDADMQSNSL